MRFSGTSFIKGAKSNFMRMLLEPIVLQQLAMAPDLHSSVKETYLKLILHPKTTITDNASVLGMGYDKLRRHIRVLQEADWAYEILEPKTKRLIVVPSMPQEVEKLLAKHWQVARSLTPYFGQWLAGCWFSLVIDDLNWIPDARPESLVSGDGSHRMEIDFMFQTARVAVEFQGKFHFEAGPSAEEQEQLRRQQERDALKALLCARKDFVFIEIAGKDLSYETIVNKLGHVLPIIPPRKERPVFRLLTDLTHTYVNYLRR